MKIVIIGAKAAGLKAACRVKRLLPDAEVTVLDEGQHVSLSACGLPYFLSADIEEFRRLLTTPYDVERTPAYFAAVKGVTVLTGIRATSIYTDQQVVHALHLETGESREFAYDELIIGTGAKPILPAIEGIDLPGVYSFTQPEEAIELRQAAAQGKLEKVAVVGGGYIGCELCEAFRALWGIDTALFEAEDQVLPHVLDAEIARVVENELQKQGVACFLNTKITGIVADGEKLTLKTDFGLDHTGFDRVVIAVGVEPRVELAEAASITIGETGGIVVDNQMRTNLPHVYAAGDCIEVKHALTGKACYLPLGSLANRQGRVAANTIAGKDDHFEPVRGASCLKVFDMNVAAVGLTVQQAAGAGFEVGESWGVFTDKADYYPEAQNLSIKMVYDKRSRRVLGVQAVSKGDAIRRVDAASVMIDQGLTLEAVRDFEPAYAPPYAMALDPLHYLAYIGITSLDEGIHAISRMEFDEIAGDYTLIDIREAVETEEKPLKMAYQQLVTIPFTKLRQNLDKIPQGKPLLVICAKGVRSAEAVRILRQAGIEDVKYVGGGLLFFQS
ncbi:FAD-dependent oxidoreductase [bacterium]|nr:FAD-dependent oxidoreductase [bacterium]